MREVTWWYKTHMSGTNVRMACNRNNLLDLHRLNMKATRGQTTYLEEYFGEPNLPVMAASNENTITDLFARTLEVCDVLPLQSRKKDPVPLYKLMEGVTDGIASSANPKGGLKRAQTTTFTTYRFIIRLYVSCRSCFIYITHSKWNSISGMGIWELLLVTVFCYKVSVTIAMLND